VVFSEEGLEITDISPELYDTLTKRLYKDWQVWVTQGANVVGAVVKLALFVAIATPVVWFWAEVSGATGLFDIRTVAIVTGLCGMLTFVIAPRCFGVRNVFAEALSSRVKRHVPALRAVSGPLSVVVYADHVEGRAAPSPLRQGGSRAGVRMGDGGMEERRSRPVAGNATVHAWRPR
jgi:hypothetical protein